MNIGTIGSGMIVREFLKGIFRLEGIFCSAMYLRHEETRCALAESFGIKRVYALHRCYEAGELTAILQS